MTRRNFMIVEITFLKNTSYFLGRVWTKINQKPKQFSIETKWNQHYHYFDGFTVDSKHGSWCNNYQAQ